MTETRSVTIRRHDGTDVADVVAVEEPLEIRLGDGRAVAITMRTPGHDEELAVGFLFGERLLQEPGDLDRVMESGANVVEVHLGAHVRPELRRVERNFYTTSSCGVCGKGSLEALGLSDYSPLRSERVLDAATIGALGDTVRAAQAVFDATGGLHAAALFAPSGELVCLREDVGRHNAVDKLVGWAVRERRVPLDDHLLYLSGRASFELLQKALAAGIPFVCAVGAPSSLAVEVADEFGITLCGFVRDGRFNVYSHAGRVGR